MTRDIDQGIRLFQRDNDLKVDGLLHPGGETEQSLFGTRTPASTAPDDVFTTVPVKKPKPQLKSQTSVPKPDKKPAPKPTSFDDTPAPTDATGRVIKDQVKEVPKPEKKPEKANPKGSLSLQLYKHYRSKKGNPVILDKKHVKNSKVFPKAIKTNQKRFEDSITKGQVGKDKHEFKDQILNMKDGETVTLKKRGRRDGRSDEWHRDISASDGIKNLDIDQALSTGSVKVKSTGDITATRQGNIVKVQGTVDNEINDVYDFNAEDTKLEKFRDMEQSGSAKSFPVKGTQVQEVDGTIEIEDGDVKNADFKWKDRD